MRVCVCVYVCVCVCECQIVYDLHTSKHNVSFTAQVSESHKNTCYCKRISSPPVTSPLHLNLLNYTLVPIATDCTQSHPAEFPLTVSARHCSRVVAISKPRLLVCQKRRTDRRYCSSCWLCSCFLTDWHTKINNPMCFHV